MLGIISTAVCIFIRDPINYTTEILDARHLICAWLPRSDLKTVRLASRLWAKAALPTLLQTVFLRINLESFGRLQEISRDATLRKHVRKVVYDGRTLSNPLADAGFHDWLSCYAGAGLGLS